MNPDGKNKRGSSNQRSDSKNKKALRNPTAFGDQTHKTAPKNSIIEEEDEEGLNPNKDKGHRRRGSDGTNRSGSDRQNPKSDSLLKSIRANN